MEKINSDKGRRRSNIRSAAIILLILTGCSALISGLSFITDPSGNGIGMHVNYLSESPFRSYLVPGILLFVFNGILNIACAMFAIQKFRQAPGFIAFQGWMLMVWIVVQVAMLQTFNLLHALCLAIGLFLLYAAVFLRKQTSFINQT